MAKRRRLTPAQSGYLSPEADLAARPAALRPEFQSAPIARIAGEASAVSALEEVAGAMAAARAEGRLVSRIPLSAIDVSYLVRDRLVVDDHDMVALIESIRAHGQRTAVEVVETAPGSYGLISGWRRMAALSRLVAETGDSRFDAALVILRRPETSGDAYVAMVEENEIRAALSYYERARIVGRSVEAGVFETERDALQRLFATASRAKRSKIGSFLAIYKGLGDTLRFPSAIPERLGLRLAQALTVPQTLHRIATALADRPASSAEEEIIRLSTLIASPAPVSIPRAREIAPGLFWEDRGHGQILLSGDGLNSDIRTALETWLRQL